MVQRIREHGFLLMSKHQDNGLILLTGDMNTVVSAHRPMDHPWLLCPLRATFGQPWMGRNACQLSHSGSQAVTKMRHAWGTGALAFQSEQKERSFAYVFSAWLFLLLSLPTSGASLPVLSGLWFFYPCNSHGITLQDTGRKQEITEESVRWPEAAKPLAPAWQPILESRPNPHPEPRNRRDWMAQKKSFQELSLGTSAPDHSIIHISIHSNT